MKRLIIIGAGGHGKVIADTATELNLYHEIAFLDDIFNCDHHKKKILIWQIIGNTKDINKTSILERFESAFVAIGNAKIRLSFISALKKLGYYIPVIKHPTSFVSNFSKVGEGTAILANSNLQADSIVGKGSILNTGSNIDHEVNLSDGVHICPGSSIAGNVSIGKNSWIGIGSSVKENINIGSNVIVGAGAVVNKNLPDNVIAKGIPAKWS